MNFASAYWINIGIVASAKRLKEKSERSLYSNQDTKKEDELPDVLFLSDDDVEPLPRISPDSPRAIADETNLGFDRSENPDSYDEVGAFRFDQSSGELEEMLKVNEKTKKALNDEIPKVFNATESLVSPAHSPLSDKIDLQSISASSKCRAKISNWKYDYDINHKPFVLYRLQVFFGGQEWISWKRFSHFKDLHNSVIFFLVIVFVS
jgi:hypothetical protein